MIMASYSNHYSLLLFSSRSPSIQISSLKFPIRLSSMIHSRRQQHPVVVVLKERSGVFLLGFSGLMEKKGLGCSSHLLQRNSWSGSIRRRCSNNKGGWGSEGEGDFALETEILEFMDCSENPNKFPTKKDLINAGRDDLAEAIEKNRDWLWKEGWDLNSRVEEEDDAGGGINNGCREKETDINGSYEMSAEIGTDVAMDNIVVQKIANETGEERSQNVQTGQNWFQSRVQHLELELASTLRPLKSAYSSLKGSDSPTDEFQETKGMNAKNKLRSIHAELAILEGEITQESQKILEIKQKRINESPSDEFLEPSDAWGETEVMNAKNKLRAIHAKLEILEGMIALVAIKNEYEDYCKLGSSMLTAAEIGNDVAADNIVVQKIANETGEDKTKTETWWRSYVNANRRELHANLKLINPDFQPPEEGRDDSEPFFYNEAERRYYYFVKDLATTVKESLKQLMMDLMVVPLSFIILAFALKDKVGVVMKTVFHDDKLSSQEQEDSDIPASDVKV